MPSTARHTLESSGGNRGTRWFAAAFLMFGLALPAAAASTDDAQLTQSAGASVAVAHPGPLRGSCTRISRGQAALLGVVEGLTEYLPVSSTGHLILAGRAMGLADWPKAGASGTPLMVKTPALDAFEIVIQLGAILAVLGLYRRRVGGMVAGVFGRDEEGLRLVGRILLAFLPAAVVGLALEKTIKAHLFQPQAVAAALGVGGVLMIAVEWALRRRPGGPMETLSARQALFIGLMQCLAMWPGVSRSMITIVAGRMAGLNRVAAAEFSFLLALPTLAAATGYEGLTHWKALEAAAGWDGLLIGLAVSGIVAALAVKGFVRWLTGHGLWPFGLYRIALAGWVFCL